MSAPRVRDSEGREARRVVLGRGDVDVSPIRLGRHFGVVFRPSDHPHPVGAETARPDMEVGTDYEARPDDVVLWFEGPDNLAALETVLEQIDVARAHLPATPRVEAHEGTAAICPACGYGFKVGRLIELPDCAPEAHEGTVREQDAGERTWRPIETAPKDATEVLGFWSTNVGPTVIIWVRGHWRWAEDLEPLDTDPTHWMPLPAPPTVETCETCRGRGVVVSPDPTGFNKWIRDPCPDCGGEDG